MSYKRVVSAARCCLRTGLATLALFQFTIGANLANASPGSNSPDNNTRTPIKHVIVIIGENRSFDHVFATYTPHGADTIDNLLSRGIVALNSDNAAIPGPNFQAAHQLAAVDQGGSDTFLLNPPTQELPNNQLPAPLVGGPSVS